MTVEDTSRVFGVTERTLYRWQQVLRERGSLAPLPHKSGNKPRVDAEGAVVVRAILAEEPDATIRETAMYFRERTDKPCSRSAMVRALHRLGITRKKKS